MPPIKKEKKLPVVLSRQECKELFKAPANLKRRFLLAFAYAGGLRMNELRLIKISPDSYRDGPASPASAHTSWQRTQATLCGLSKTAYR